jgi:hypothetical protein
MKSYNQLVNLMGKKAADKLVVREAATTTKTEPARNFQQLSLLFRQPATVQKPMDRAEKLNSLGKNAVKVWNFLQAHEDAVLKETVAINHSHFTTIQEVSKALDMPLNTVAGAVVTLAQNGFISQITPEGKIAA